MEGGRVRDGGREGEGWREGEEWREGEGGRVRDASPVAIVTYQAASESLVVLAQSACCAISAFMFSWSRDLMNSRARSNILSWVYISTACRVS